MNQLGKPLENAVEMLGWSSVGLQRGAVLGEWRCGGNVAGDVGDAQVRTDLDLEGKLRRVPLPNGGMEHHAKGLARGGRGWLLGFDEGHEQRT